LRFFGAGGWADDMSGKRSNGRRLVLGTVI